MVKPLDVSLIVIALVLTILSLTAISITGNNAEDYREEMSEDCSFAGGLCQRTQSNPYTSFRGEYICKHHIVEIAHRNANQIIKKLGSKFKDPDKVKDNLFDHVKFYSMVENALVLIPIFQFVTFILIVAIVIVRIATNNARELGENNAFFFLTFCQATSCCVLTACVFGLAIMEIDFDSCLSSNSPEWMLTNITFAKFLFWTWLTANIALAVAVLFAGIAYFIAKDAEDPNRLPKPALCLGGIGSVIAGLAGSFLLLSSLIGLVLYFILWFTAGNI